MTAQKSDIRLRRFEEIHFASPESVQSLSEDHDAIVHGEPLFSRMVIGAWSAKNVLISAMSNRKIGRMVQKGPWKGMPIYTLTLPERTTCPVSCHVYASCYGNAMPFANRIAPGANLEARLKKDVPLLAEKHPKGFVVRLHTLGDFYSPRYVELWGKFLANYPALHIFGYTARGVLRSSEDLAITSQIAVLKQLYGRRFSIRWSRSEPTADGATVIDYRPSGKAKEGIICPAEIEATAACSTCGLCWAEDMKDKTIVFLKHGMGSDHKRGVAQEVNAAGDADMRQVAPIKSIAKHAGEPKGELPSLLWIDPTKLWIEKSYQRDLSRAGGSLIMKIVEQWDWALFTPPKCAKVGDKLFCYDGQHTAISAASHPRIGEIPIIASTIADVQARAKYFIAANWDRIRPTRLQKWKSEITADIPKAIEVKRILDAAEIELLVAPPPNRVYLPGQTQALVDVERSLSEYGRDITVRALRILSRAGLTPILGEQIRACAALLGLPEWRDTLNDTDLQELFASIKFAELKQRARDVAQETGQPIWRAIALEYYRAATR